ATGFLFSGPDMPDLNDQFERRHVLLNEMTSAAGEVFLGLQIGCAQCQRAANLKRDQELEKIRARYDKKIDALEAKLAAEARELNQNEQELQARESESRWTGIENLLGVAIGRSPYRMFSTSEQKKRLAQKAKHDVSESQETIAQLEAQITALKEEAQPLFQAVAEKWSATAQDIHELRLTPKRSDILVELFGVGWRPHWQIEADEQMIEIAASG
ncbi:MAG: hypothetical protein L0099_00130, partial [Acidobacteria bacterium]|nr:hypothetical protein [Acidobacteriota bacterium]